MLVDIGYKSEGVIPVAELSIRRSVNPEDEVKLGDEIDALVLTKEDADGRLILSKKRARFEIAWKAIEGAPRAASPSTGSVIEVVKGGLILDLGVRGFLPASLVDIRRVQDLDEFLGQELRCKVIELNRSRNNVVLSRRAVLEDERKEMRQAILDRLRPGDVVEGQISNIVDFGAFVDLDGMDGLIHISELSWSHVNHPSEVLEIGQDVQVKVLDIDRERQRISLGLKQTQSDPWQQVVDAYNESDVVQGKVTKVVTFGAFVEIMPGVEGLVHISELAQHHVENPREVVSQGDVVNVKIIEVDADRRRLSLSLKRVDEGDDVQPRADGQPLERLRRRRSTSRTRSSRTSRRLPRPRTSTLSRRARRSSEPDVEESCRGAEPEEPVAEVAPEADEPRARRRGRSGAARACRGRRRGEDDSRRTRSTRHTGPASEATPRRPRRVSSPRARPRRPLAVAITGGIGAGKSEALAAFARHGAATISSDEIVHELYDDDPTCRPRWSSGSADGSTGARSGSRPSETVTRSIWLEGLLHPLVIERTEAWRDELSQLPDPPNLAVNEVPLLYEAGAEGRFDAVVVITAPRELRAARARRPLDEREQRLLPDQEKVRRADFAYVNDGSLEELDAFVADVVRRLSAVRRVVPVAVLVLAVSVGLVYFRHGEPTFVDRIRYPLRYGQIVRGHAKNYDLDPALVAAVIYQESKFRADAKSSSGAIGLMQLRPDTAKGIAIRTGGSRFQVSDLYNPEINIRYGSWYLRHLLDKYGDERMRSPRTTRASGTSTSGAPRARASSSRRRARTSTGWSI